MDFLDSLDLNTTNEKSSRVRSWYLYEQFKSLERNQLEAAQKLKDRSYQERILHRELSERKVRRKLYDQIEVQDTQSTRDKCERTKSLATNDVFESFCELKDDQSDSTEPNVFEDSQDDSQPDKGCIDDFKSVSDCKDEQSCDENVNSITETFEGNVKSFAEEIKEELELVKKNIAENISLHLETVEESLQCLEEYSEMCNDDKISETESYNSEESETEKVIARLNSTTHVNNVIAVWSKLVSFAYQIIKLNKGNCYNDYGSQLSTAVLACDVLRRGISRMCHILQPYVSPIKFATDDSDSSSNGDKNANRKIKVFMKKSRNKHTKRNPCKMRMGKNQCKNKKYHSDNCIKQSFGNTNFKRTSEPLHSVARSSTFKQEPTDFTESTIWPEFSRGNSVKHLNCSCYAKVSNPMLKIAQYFDRLLADIEDCNNT